MASSSEGGNNLAKVLKSLASLHPTFNASMDCISKKFASILHSYEKIVINDPEKIAKIESALSLISFILPGHFRSSDVVSELVYFATKMMALLHDIIYRRKFSEVHTFLWTDKTYLQTVLTVVEYTEAFLELGATRLWGDPGKWLVIFTLQILKATLKIILLFYFNSGIQHSPSLLLVREKMRNEPSKDADGNESAEIAWPEANTPSKKHDVWSGRRSGRVIRSLQSVPPRGFRDWKLPSKQHDDAQGAAYFKSNSDLSYTEKVAELAYILRPIGHLTTIFFCGENSWKPWLLSLAVDLSSLHHLQSKRTLHRYEKDEILRRKATLLIYLLRSPFYDNYSKSKIVMLLDGLSRWVPGAKFVSGPLKEYLPIWQKIYSHNWST